MALKRWSSLVLAGFSMACATTSPPRAQFGKPVVAFPSDGDLSNVSARPAQPAPPFETVEVDRWVLQTPVPAPGAPYDVTNQWDELLTKLVAEQGGRLVASSSLACAARETARFYVERGAAPGEGLQQFLAGRCGSTLVAPRLAVFGGPTPDDVPEEAVQIKLGEKFPDFLKAQLPRGRGEVGLGYARGNGRVVIAFYGGDQLARLDGFQPLVGGDRAILEGELPAIAAFGLAAINQGANGFAFCDADSAVQLPRFRFECPMLGTDTHARVEVAIRKAGQILPEPVLSAELRRADDAGLTYEPALPGDLAANLDENAFQAAVVTKVNEIRRSAGLAPLELDPEQSKTNARVAPHWFDAKFKGDAATVELLSMGLLAGWQVQGTIRDAGIYSGYLAKTRSPERWVSDALASPLARSVLLDPRAARVAVGTGGLGPSGIFGVVTAYSFFEPQRRPADESDVFAELARARESRGLPAPRKARRPPALDHALARIAASEQDPASAIQTALEKVKETEQRTVYGWALETNDLKQLKWSDRLLTPGLLDMTVGVTHYRAPGGAWGQYAVLVVLYDNAEPKQRPAIEGTQGPDKLY